MCQGRQTCNYANQKLLRLIHVTEIKLFVFHVYFSQETCDNNLNITMCPLCDAVCDYWRLSSVCSLAQASYLFDNGATVLFAIFMSLWGNYKNQLYIYKPSISKLSIV